DLGQPVRPAPGDAVRHHALQAAHAAHDHLRRSGRARARQRIGPMKITSVQATWVHVPIPFERQHVSDFGRIASFDSVVVKISAIAGVDIALWDLLGKSLGAPVWRLLGGRRAERMPAYASGGWADEARIGEQLLGYVEKGGFRAVKMRVGVMDGEPHKSAARVRAARKALGPDVKLMADAHGTWTVAEAKAFCRMVEDCDLYWLEEPVTADDKTGLAEVRRASTVPIATGESEFTRHDFREIAELRAADVLQPDLAIAGGLTEGVRIGAIASAYNLRLAPHL